MPMTRTRAISLACLLAACGGSDPVDEVGHNETDTSTGDGDDDPSGDGDDDPSGDGDDDPSGDGDDDPSGDGDDDPSGDGDDDPSGDGDDDPSGDGDGNDCLPLLIDGSVVLNQDSTPADFAALECVEEITGNLDIQSTEVADLHFAASLVRVGGRLRILSNHQLSTLAGLDQLEEIGGALAIDNNQSLTSLEGLGSLRELARLSIARNDALLSVAGFAGDLHFRDANPEAETVWITIDANDSLLSLDGFAGLSSLTADLPLNLTIRANPQLGGTLVGFAEFVHDDLQLGLVIHDNALDSLTGLEALTHVRHLRLYGPGGHYTSLHGLDNLTHITEVLQVGRCHTNPLDSHTFHDQGLAYLETLAGLESLVEVGGLSIWGNLALTSINALANLETAGWVSIHENPVLSQAEATELFADVEVLGGLLIDYNGLGGSETSCKAIEGQ
jgi:hypothetical protein